MGEVTLMMEIDHIRFYVEDAAAQRDWFVNAMGCQPLASVTDTHTHTEVLRTGPVYFVLSSALTSASPVCDYLKSHPAGVVDVALRVQNIEQILAASAISSAICRHSYTSGEIKWVKVQGWDTLSHTLIENTASIAFCDFMFGQNSTRAVPSATLPPALPDGSVVPSGPTFTQIDHVVLNVPAGALEQAVEWYKSLLGFQVQQVFNIQTPNSGVKSQVLASAQGEVYFNINEPISANSQIQDFLNLNRGSGIQHVALRTSNIVQAVVQMRQRGQSFLSIPAAYYTHLKQRLTQQVMPLLQSKELQEVQSQQILVDWQQDARSMLLQIFTQPIFKHPTFFLS